MKKMMLMPIMTTIFATRTYEPSEQYNNFPPKETFFWKPKNHMLEEKNNDSTEKDCYLEIIHNLKVHNENNFYATLNKC